MHLFFLGVTLILVMRVGWIGLVAALMFLLFTPLTYFLAKQNGEIFSACKQMAFQSKSAVFGVFDETISGLAQLKMFEKIGSANLFRYRIYKLRPILPMMSLREVTVLFRDCY